MEKDFFVSGLICGFGYNTYLLLIKRKFTVDYSEFISSLIPLQLVPTTIFILKDHRMFNMYYNQMSSFGIAFSCNLGFCVAKLFFLGCFIVQEKIKTFRNEIITQMREEFKN